MTVSGGRDVVSEVAQRGVADAREGNPRGPLYESGTVEPNRPAICWVKFSGRCSEERDGAGCYSA